MKRPPGRPRKHYKPRDRTKRDHRIECLKCERFFLSSDLKAHRICDKCKGWSDWSGNDLG